LSREKGAARSDQTIEGYRIKDPIVLAPEDEVHKAAATMAAKQIRRLPVIENDKLVGTVSRADVCRAVVSRKR
jgi:CBS domain-containing protein